MPELIEAAVRVDDIDLAAQVDRRLSERCGQSGTDWALGIAARSHAMLMEGDRAGELYREAIERLGRTRMRVDLARSHLLYGEWLRRERRRRDARAELRTAHELFSSFGMEAFAQRAKTELLATGEKVRSRTLESSYKLTPQEQRITELAAHGATNKEIAAQLYISAATVEYHLHKVFRKFGVTSRGQLAHHWLQSTRKSASG
jgi:DNA-binding CsgD family transcriptional regulator